MSPFRIISCFNWISPLIGLVGNWLCHGHTCSIDTGGRAAVNIFDMKALLDRAGIRSWGWEDRGDGKLWFSIRDEDGPRLDALLASIGSYPKPNDWSPLPLALGMSAILLVFLWWAAGKSNIMMDAQKLLGEIFNPFHP